MGKRKKSLVAKKPKNNKIKVANDGDESKQAITRKIKLYEVNELYILAIPEGNKLMKLRTIFDSVTADPKEWPRIVFFAVQTRFERMPRNGWTELHRYYNEKFGCTETLEVLKKLAQSEMGKEVKSEEDGYDVQSPLVSLIHASKPTLLSTLNLRDKFSSKIKEISEKKIEKVVATRKEKPRSAWKENIESKISKLVLFKNLLEKARKQEKLSTSETKSLKKIMREFNLNLSSVTDLSEAIVKKNESLNVYEKKITMYESRKMFRKKSRMFERFRGRFHRGSSEHVVSRDEIVSFWSILTAGIYGIYNFFIEKLTTLHKYIYDIVKVIYIEGTPQPDWFYCGLTYLILKGIPRRGSDYRPITCMSNLYKLTTKCVTKVVQIEVERRGLLAEKQLGAVRGVQGAKEQALLNIALNKEYGNNLEATWIYVKKAYNSVDPAYTLKAMTRDINKEKSAPNDTFCEDTVILLKSVSLSTRSSFDAVQGKPILKIKYIKIFSLFNEHAISLINYHIGCLYLPRTELGRGLHSVKLRSEHMLLRNTTRRPAILKYRLVEEVTKKSLEEAQLAKLYNEIEKRKLHSKLYNARKNELVSVSDSSRWLKRGNIRPRNEAVFCYIQDRNVFWGADGVCQHCGKSGKTVDHLATRCEKMLSHDYTRRHNEVVICLHLLLLNRY
ncbi:hypothetical protein CWI38_0879p0020, partial [Hamiltosporidium tvaerminnensis]